MPRKKAEPKGRVVIYTRVSTTGQADDGLSLALQARKSKDYAKAMDLEVVGVHEDAGQSAKSLDRPGLKEAIEALLNGDAQSLLIYKLDRLTRSISDLGTLIETYFAEGKEWTLLSVSDSIDTRTANGRLSLHLLMTVAQWERETIAERTRAAMQHKKSLGEYTGGAPPFGSKIKLVKGVKMLVDCPKEMKVIDLALELRKLGYSLQRIANSLNANGANPRTNKKWTKQSVSRILESWQLT